MEEIRRLIQEEFDQLTSVDCGVPIPDGMVEEGKTYFGYELQEINLGSDLDKRYLMQISLTGRLVRKELENEDTLHIIDTALSDIKNALKTLNFKYSYNDITFQDGIRKIFVRATVSYWEQNNTLII